MMPYPVQDEYEREVDVMLIYMRGQPAFAQKYISNPHVFGQETEHAIVHQKISFENHATDYLYGHSGLMPRYEKQWQDDCIFFPDPSFFCNHYV